MYLANSIEINALLFKRERKENVYRASYEEERKRWERWGCKLEFTFIQQLHSAGGKVVDNDNSKAAKEMLWLTEWKNR